MTSPENPNQFAHHSPEQTSGIEDDLTDNPARPYIEIRADDMRLGDVPCPPEWREFIDSHKPEEQIDLARKLVQSSILENQKRVESVSQKPANTGMTICVPLAIRYETPETIERLIQQIISASNGVENGVNVLIWANAKYKDHEEFSSVEQEVSMSYKELRQQLQRFEQESDTVTISTAMDKIVPDEQFSMSQIRNNYMEAITGRLIDGELEEDHPTVWLDADTTRIRPNTLSAYKDTLKKTRTSSTIRTLIILLNGWKENGPRSGMSIASYYLLTRWLSASISELQWRKASKFLIEHTQTNVVLASLCINL